MSDVDSNNKFLIQIEVGVPAWVWEHDVVAACGEAIERAQSDGDFPAGVSYSLLPPLEIKGTWKVEFQVPGDDGKAFPYTAEGLQDVYSPEGGGEHPEFTRRDWRWAVENDDTISGYWGWVASELNNRVIHGGDEEGAED